MRNNVRQPRKGWMLYFLASIGVVGFVTCYVLAMPLCLLGWWFPSLWRLGGRILTYGVSLLLRIQPWYDGEVALNLPAPSPGKPGFMTVSNHRSHLDMFILLSRVPNIRAITKQSLYYVPFLSLMLRVFRMIPVRRGKNESYLDAMEVAERAIESGDPVHVFPEMTRCKEGTAGTGEFHLLPFRMARHAGAPIYPVVFVGTDHSWPKGVFGIRSGGKVRVRTLSPIDPKRYPSASTLRDEVKRRIDEELHVHGS